jgi:signal peptidase II
VKYRNAVLIVLLIILIDQALKIYVKTHMYYGVEGEIRIIGDWFRFHFLENEGMAFGMKLSDKENYKVLAKVILTLFRLVAVIFGFFLLKRLVDKQYTRGAILCGALILAGAAGNLIDSMFYGLIFSHSSYHVRELAHFTSFGQGYGEFLQGKVVDMFYFPLFSGTFPKWVPVWGGSRFEFFEPVFNFADAAISLGVLTLVFFQKRLIHKKAIPPVAAEQQEA